MISSFSLFYFYISLSIFLLDIFLFLHISHHYRNSSRLAYGTSRPCSYYDRGIKVRTRVGQNSLMFELLPIHGSFSMPTITLNILAYSNTSSILTHLTTFNTIPFMTTIISSYFLFFKLLLSYVLLLYIPHIFKHAK